MKTRKLKKTDIAFKLIGQATVIVLFHIGLVAMFMWGFLQNTIY